MDVCKLHDHTIVIYEFRSGCKGCPLCEAKEEIDQWEREDQKRRKAEDAKNNPSGN